MKLWDFALAAYASHEVREACLKLQDEDGQCVCLLLWAGWAASENRSIEPETLVHAIAAARGWEHGVAAPLRAARRSLKSNGRAALAEAVSAVEIEAERLLLTELEGLTPPPATSAIDQLMALLAVASAWSAAISQKALEPLADALGRACRRLEL